MILTLVNTPFTMLPDHGFLILAIGATVLGLFLRARAANSLPKELSLIREKPQNKHFSIKTRLAFYFHCSSLYRDIWDKVRPYSHLSRKIDLVPAVKVIQKAHCSDSSPKKASRCLYPHSAFERTFSSRTAL